MFRSVWHTSWTVSDLDRSLAFYQDLMGFEVIARKHRTGDYIEAMVGYPDAELKIAMLRLATAGPNASGHHLELIEYVSPCGERPELRTCNVGAAHLALESDDIHADYERLLAAGVFFVSPPLRIPPPAAPGGFACYLRDPDGFTLELVQPLAV